MRPPTYWWEPDGAVDLLRMTAPPHSLSPADLPVGTRRRGRPSEDDCAAALYSPADLPVGTRRRRGPFEDHGVAALSIHLPTYRREPDGAVDLLRMTAYLTLRLLD